jgi:hypothetical protein
MTAEGAGVAKQNTELRRYAVLGAEQRLVQISAEVEAIYNSFPELRRSGRGRRSSGRGAQSAAGSFGGGTQDGREEQQPRRRRRGRRKMSAEARKRISDAQKARWARQKGEGGAAKGAAARKK